MRRALIAALAAAASLLIVVPAQADTYLVTGTGDDEVPPACQLLQPTVHTCTMLRAAVNEAVDSDAIYLQAPGEYALTYSSLDLIHDVALFGLGPGQTTITATHDFRVLTVGQGANASVANLTIADGAGEGGGNVYVEGGAKLTLTVVHVTGGTATYGAGVANFGLLTVFASLFDGNVAESQGGAIYSYGEAPGSGLTLADSTLAANTAPTGSALYSLGSTSSTINVIHSTIARNTGDAIGFSSQGPTTAVYGSLIGPNSGANCTGGAFGTATASIESANSCGLNLPNTDVGLASQLTNPGGGPTSVLTIPATSPAVDFVNPCLSGSDQQLTARSTPACDAGAYEVVSTPPPPTPTPTPVPPAPTPTPTATPAPTPVAGKSVGAETVTGRVLVRVPGSKRFVALEDGVIPNGTEVDARKGSIEIDRSDGGRATFRSGLFKISQAGGLTTLTLTEKLTCPKKPRRAAAHAAAKKVKTRKLFGSGKGKFRTKGQYGAATVRGTKWTTTDTCTSTTVKVTQGAVTFRDLVKRKNIVVRKGKSATARARR